MESQEMNIVDRLTLALEMADHNPQNTSVLIRDARDEIHKLQGLVYAYPKFEPYLSDGRTWRAEYEELYSTIAAFDVEEFLLWKNAMQE
jgi:hypothetical protein